MSPKIILQPDEIERQVKETRALIRAAERALARHAKKTRTVFIGRAGSVEVKGSGDE
jgi:hypothetical protein